MIEENTCTLNNPEFTWAAALDFAAPCEQNLLNARFCEFFEGSCPEVKRMQYALDLVVREHYRRIKEKIAAISSGSSFPENRDS